MRCLFWVDLSLLSSFDFRRSATLIRVESTPKPSWRALSNTYETELREVI